MFSIELGHGWCSICICRIHDVTSVLLIVSATVLILKVRLLLMESLVTCVKEKKKIKKITRLFISQERLFYYIINCFLEKRGWDLKDICGKVVGMLSLSVTVSAVLRTPSEWAGLEWCFVRWDSALLAGAEVQGVGFDPRIDKPDAGQPMTW